MFKSGSVRLEKLPPSSTSPHIREQHTAAVHKTASKSATTTTNPQDLTNRQRQLELWLGETYETTVQLLSIYETLIPSLIHDLEVEAGLRVLHRIADEMRAALEPAVQRYGENKQRGRHRAHVLRDALFPGEEETERGAYEVLETLQGLAVYLAHIRGSVTALQPAAQALWDEGFVEGVGTALKCLGRMESWVGHQVKVRSPQTLLVPVRKPKE
jgi:ferredoxin-nitrate reductase